MNTANQDLPSKQNSPKSSNAKTESQEVSAEEILEIAEKAGPHVKERILGLIQQKHSVSYMGPFIDPIQRALLEKCTQKTFASMIENMEKESI